MHGVVETPTFLANAKSAGVTDEERQRIVAIVAADPKAGDVMPGTGGARKLRYARDGKGKSGGYRVITYFAGDDVPVFLLDLYGKGDKANLTKAEQNALAKILSKVGGAYRASAALEAKKRRKDKR